MQPDVLLFRAEIYKLSRTHGCHSASTAFLTISGWLLRCVIISVLELVFFYLLFVI